MGIHLQEGTHTLHKGEVAQPRSQVAPGSWMPWKGETSLGFYSWVPRALEGQWGHMPYAVSSAQWGRKQKSSSGK